MTLVILGAAFILLMAVGMVVAGLSGGCSLGSMEKKVKDVSGRADKNETRAELNSAGRKRLAALPGLTDARRRQDRCQPPV